MSEFRVMKVKREKELIKSVMYRFEDYATQKAFSDALDDSGLSAQRLVDQMMKHCLKEANYLEAKHEKDPS